MHLYFTQMDPVPDGVTETLSAKGWWVGHHPFRKVVFRQVKPAFDQTQLIVITSKQAARWLLAQKVPNLPPVAAVGATTNRLLVGRRLLFDPTQEAPPANADELVARLEKHPEFQDILFLSGARIRDTVEKRLNNRNVRREIVYHTEKIANYPRLQCPAMVYFQAPGSVADYRENEPSPPALIGAIGPSTAKALHGLGWPIHFQPGRPENTIFAKEIPGPEYFRKIC